MGRPQTHVPDIDRLNTAVLVGKVLEVFATQQPGREKVEVGLVGRGEGGVDEAVGGFGLGRRGGAGGKLCRGVELAG